MERPAWAPHGIDLSVPSVSRIYDYYLGGSHNFEVDREAGRRAIEAFPGLPKIMQANRALMRRAVRFAVDEGITQFLDIGSGIPTFGNVHEVAQAANPASRVVYVDHDPVAVAHSRAVLDGHENAVIVAADLRSPRDILDSEETGRGCWTSTARWPCCWSPSCTSSRTPTTPPRPSPNCATRSPRAACSFSPMPPWKAARSRPEEGERVENVYRRASSPLIMRSRDAVEAFFDGFELVEPGLVSPPLWRPDGSDDDELDPVVFSGFAGVGRKA